MTSLPDQVDIAIREADIAADGASVTARLCFPPDLEVFAGHFPDGPIVPGVMLIEAARRLAQRAAGRPLTVDEVGDARFTAPVFPDTDAHMSLQLVQTTAAVSERFEVTARVTVGEREAMRAWLVLVARER